MKNANEFLNIRKLITKYEGVGLKIDVEFNHWGIIFHGYWDRLALTQIFNKEYTYDFIITTSDAIDMEFLIDEFKKEFEDKIKEIQYD